MKHLLHHRIFLRAAVPALLLGVAHTSRAQPVIAVPSVRPSASQLQPGLGGTKPESYSNIGSAFQLLPPLTTWAAVNVRPHFLYSIIYGDGILRVPGEPTTSTVQSVTAGVVFELGKYWTLNYAGSRTWNSSRLLADYTSHDAALSGAVAKGDWTFGVTQTYASKTPTLIETAQQVPEVSHSTGASVAYQFGTRSLINVQLTRNVRDSDFAQETEIATAQDMEQWSGSVSWHYQVSPKLDLAVGAKLGRERLSNSPDMNTSEPHVTVTWQPTLKLGFVGTWGVETRQFRGGVAEDLDSDVYSASGTYRPTKTTTFSVNANRLVSPSYFAGQLSRTSGWGADLEQRFLQRLYVVVGYQHGETSYVVPVQGFTIGRADDFNTYHAKVSTLFMTRGTIGLSYQRTKNNSTDPGFAFTSYQVGAEVGFRF